MRAVVRITFYNQKKFLGRARMLLEEIQRCHSIRQAAKAMKMSYTKALRMLQTLEQEIGFDVVHSVKGGNQRGGTILTEAGEQLLNTFLEIEAEIQTYAEKIVAEKFDKIPVETQAKN